MSRANSPSPSAVVAADTPAHRTVPRVLFCVSADTSTTTDAVPGATAGDKPLKDYTAIASALQADVLDWSRVRWSTVGRLLSRTSSVAIAQAWLAFSRRHVYDAILTDGEHIGLPLALLLKLAGARVPHVTIGHRITARKKRPLLTRLRAWTHIETILLHSTLQRDLAQRHLNIPSGRLALVPYQVDTQFWDPARLPEVTEERLIASAGLELRDYPTLFEAVRGFDAQVIVAAASYWSKRRNTALDAQPPPNARVTALDYGALRRLYAQAAVVVVPLQETDFQAGVTTILEAMAMGKPVVVTETSGQTDVVVDRRAMTRSHPSRARPVSLLAPIAAEHGIPLEPNGMYVPVGDADTLRQTIRYLLDNPEERRRLGGAGRRMVERLMRVDQFADRVAATVHAAVRAKAVAPAPNYDAHTEQTPSTARPSWTVP